MKLLFNMVYHLSYGLFWFMSESLMSLITIPFVDSGIDTGLHLVASIILISSIGAVIYGFWRIHELPISKAHSKEHHQIGLITALTWIGFIWHWVWVLAVIIAFTDIENAIIHLRDIWKGQPQTSIEPTETIEGKKEC